MVRRVRGRAPTAARVARSGRESASASPVAVSVPIRTMRTATTASPTSGRVKLSMKPRSVKTCAVLLTPRTDSSSRAWVAVLIGAPADSTPPVRWFCSPRAVAPAGVTTIGSTFAA